MDTEYKSRTQKKKEDQALQRLGEQLVALPPGRMETLELPEELMAAVQEYIIEKSDGNDARRNRK